MLVKPMYRSFLQNNRHIWAALLMLGLGVGVQAQSIVNTAHVVDGCAKVGGGQVELIDAVG
jgi:hypothetical protein